MGMGGTNGFGRLLRQAIAEAPDAAAGDILLGQAALDRHLVTPQQLEDGRRQQRRWEAQGRFLPLGQVLVEEGLLSPQEVEDLQRIVGKPPTQVLSPDEIFDASMTGALAEGKRIGRYEVARIVGRGGMGVVFEAFDPELRRRVALKVIRPDSATAESHARLQREAAIVAQLNHPNIVQIYEVGTPRPDQPYHYLAMEYVEGASLRDLLKHGKGKREELLDVLEHAARAVGHAHRNGVVHRDLKPDNIVVESGGRVVLLDFGLARARIFASKLTQSREVLGTPHYMAPEQVEGKARELDARADIYALGAILYEILVGKPPFHSKTLTQLYECILHQEPPAPRKLRPETPRELETICFKAMEKEKARRYGRAVEFAEDLARYRKGEPIQARPASWTYRLRRRFAKRRGFVASVVATAILAATGTAWAGLRLSRAGDFRRAQEGAKVAWSAGDWYTARSEATRALAIREDPHVRKILNECTTHLSEAAEQSARAAYRRWLEIEKVKPLERKIHEARPMFYTPKIDIQAKLAEVEEALCELEELSRDPRADDAVEIWVMLGMGWHFIGDSTRAKMFLERAQVLAPEHPDVNVTLALIYFERVLAVYVGGWGGNWEGFKPYDQESSEEFARQAMSYLDRATQAGWKGSAVITHTLSAYRALAKREWDEVTRLCQEGVRQFADALGTEELWVLLGFRERDETAFTRAIERKPHFAIAYRGRAQHRARRGDHRGAIEDFSAAIRLNPRYPELYYGRALSYTNLGDYAQAIADYSEAIRILPNFSYAYTNRGDVRHLIGDYEGAVADATVAIEQFPGNFVAWANRGFARLARWDPDGAIDDCTKALEINPNHPFGYIYRAEAYRFLGQLDRALEDANAAIRLDSTLTEAHYVRGMILVSRGDLERAERDAEALLRILPQSEQNIPSLSKRWYFDLRANIHVAQGDPEAAVLDRTEGIRLEPGNGTLRRERASLWLRLRKWKEALADYDEALKIHPNDATSYRGRGTAYLVLGKLPEALSDFDAGLRLDANDPELYAMRAQCRQALGHLDTALEDYAKCLKMASPEWPLRRTVEEAHRSLVDSAIQPKK